MQYVVGDLGLEPGDAQSDDVAGVAEAHDDPGLTEALLEALAAMAVRSKRRQADVIAALRHAGLRIDDSQIINTVQQLQKNGAVDTLVPLSDGGLLLSVTTLGMEQVHRTIRRRLAEKTGEGHRSHNLALDFAAA